ncbi:MAG: PAS domain S-box protein [Hormoscilla sp. GUM202]|nr:PAS domain S-box protein [Hormoscilla sp. GUM202]
MDYADATENPELLELFIEQTPTAVAVLDRDMRYIITSHIWLKDYGLGTVDLRGRSHYEVFPDLSLRWKQIYAECLAGYSQQSGEDTVEKANGEPFWVKWKIEPWRTKTGEIGGLILWTEPIASPSALEQSEENRFQTLTANVPGMIYQFLLQADAGVCFPYVSPRCLSLCELEPEALQQDAHLFFELLHPDDRQGFEASITASVNTLQPWRWEGRIITPSGQIKWLSVTTAPPERQASPGNGKGDILWDGLIVDITHRKQTEIALREQEAELRALFESMTDIILVLDGGGRYLKVAPTNSQLLVQPTVEMLGMTLHDMLPKDAADRMLLSIQRALDTRQTIDVEYSMSIGESRVWFAAKISPLHRVKVEITSDDGLNSSLLNNYEDTVICVARDITARKRSESQLEHYKEELELRVEQRTAQLAAERSELQQVEKSLRQHVQMLELANDTIMIRDLEGKISYWNSGAQKLYGWTKQGVKDRVAHRLLQTEFPEPLEAIEAELLEEGYWEGELVQTKRNGEQVTVGTRWTLQRDESGQVAAILEISNDITQRKQAEAALRKSEELYRTLAHNFPNGAVLLFDHRLRFTLAEGREISFLVGGQKRLEGKTLDAIFPPKVGEILEPNYRVALQGIARAAEVAIADRFYLVQTLPVQNDRAEIIAGMCLIQNITERKQQEDALRESETRHRKLAQRKELLNRLASQVRNSLDLDQIMQTAVTEIRDLLQIDRCMFVWYRSDEAEPAWEVVKEAKRSDIPSLLGRFPLDRGPLVVKLLSLETIRADNLADTSDPVLQELHAQVGYTSTLTLPIRSSQGCIGAVSCGHFSGPSPWSDGEVELLESVIDQLTLAISQAELYAQATEAAAIVNEKREQLEQTLHKLRRTQSQLIQSEKMSSLGQLVAGIAHEINNPVNFIYANIEPARNSITDILSLLQLYSEHDPEPSAEIQDKIDEIDFDFLSKDLQRMLSSMQNGADRIGKIVLSLRNFSRLDESDMKAADIHSGIDSTLMLLQNRLKNQSGEPIIQVHKEYGNLPKIECYPGQLNQVFIGILNNAIDALEEFYGLGDSSSPQTPESGESNNPIPTIRIITEKIDADHVAIRIIDNGPGITESAKNHLFDPFFTTKAVGKGTGLGLAISYQIVVEKHGGTLECISAPGEGAEFAIAIPIRQFHGPANS